jgi:pyridoxamine 5'-phosphate oxidase
MTTRRIDYEGEGLAEGEVAPAPFPLVQRWVEDAVERDVERGDVPEPTALSVATVDAADVPDVRTVLMRFLDTRGPGFVTNLGSAKAAQLRERPGIAAALTWPSMFRAIRFRGTAELVPREEVAEYYRQRPWASRISAWASRQSAPLTSRADLERTFAEYAARWPDRGGPDDVPVPDFWGGVRVRADTVEFWAGRRDRLHDRLRYRRAAGGDLADPHSWSWERLQP